jgi:hypothetical protein
MKSIITKVNWICLVLGVFLLIPPVISVFVFISTLSRPKNSFVYFENTPWTGIFLGLNGSAYTSALPFYFGMMAIAGAILISKSIKNNQEIIN